MCHESVTLLCWGLGVLRLSLDRGLTWLKLKVCTSGLGRFSDGLFLVYPPNGQKSLNTASKFCNLQPGSIVLCVCPLALWMVEEV